MFAFKIDSGKAQALSIMLDIPLEVGVEDYGKDYYLIVDVTSENVIVTTEELVELEKTEGEDYIRFE